jgi:hypothetical protein
MVFYKKASPFLHVNGKRLEKCIGRWFFFRKDSEWFTTKIHAL